MYDRILYIKGHELKIYSDDYVRKNGKKCDEITIGYGGVGGQYVYLNTSDRSGYELPVSGLVYEEYSDGRMWYYTTCNDVGLPCNGIASAEYYENGSLHNASFYNFDEEYGVSVHYDTNGIVLSEKLGTDEYEENTYFKSDGTKESERISDRINDIDYYVRYNNKEKISEATYGYRKNNFSKWILFYIRENNYISKVSKDSKRYRFKWNIIDVSEKNDCTLISFSKICGSVEIEKNKRVWNEEGFLSCKHELIETDLIHGVYWNDNGTLIKEYFGVSEMLIELIYDETENITDQAFYYRNKFYSGHLEINNIKKTISLIDDEGNEVVNIKHSNHTTEISADIDENNIKIMLDTLRPDEKAFSVADAPKDTRGFVEYLLEKTRKYLDGNDIP